MPREATVAAKDAVAWLDARCGDQVQFYVELEYDDHSVTVVRVTLSGELVHGDRPNEYLIGESRFDIPEEAGPTEVGLRGLAESEGLRVRIADRVNFLVWAFTEGVR